MKDLIEKLCVVLETLSKKIRDIYNHNSFQVKYKDWENKDPLTTADLYANDFLKENLIKFIPKAGWISEESKVNSDRFNKEYIWVVDPIDGTREFVKKHNGFSISVGLLKNNKPILGAIAMPAENYFVLGFIEEEESLLFTQNIDTHERNYFRSFQYEDKVLEEAKIVVSRSEWNSGKIKSLPSHWNFHLEGSIARKLAMVSLKQYDLVISLTPKNEWDICGGFVLIQVSHQKSSTLEWMHFSGKPLYNEFSFNKKNLHSMGLVAGNPYLVEKYLEFHYKNQIPVFDRYD